MDRGKREKKVQISGWWQPPPMGAQPNNHTEVCRHQVLFTDSRITHGEILPQ